MAKKYDPEIEAATSKLDDVLNRIVADTTRASKKTAKAAPKSATSSFLLSMFKSVFLPALGPLLGEALKGASAKTRSYAIKARDILIAADLGDA